MTRRSIWAPVTVALFSLVSICSSDVIRYEDSGAVVADYADDFQGPVSSPGWSYWWNGPIGWTPDGAAGDGASNPIGTSSNYLPLIWTGGQWNADGDLTTGNHQPAGFLRLQPDGGHPALGSTQTGNVGNSQDRYAIAAFTVSTGGTYRITDSRFSRNTVGTTGLDVKAFIDETAVPELTVDGHNNTTAIAFDGLIGDVAVSQIVYVAVGPHGNAGSDTFQIDYSIRQEPSYDLRGDRSELDDHILLVSERAVLLAEDLEVDRVIDGGEIVGPGADLETHHLSAGMYVTSYLFHFDPIAGTTASGSFTFDVPVSAILFTPAKLDATDALLGSPLITYPSDGGVTTLHRGCLSEPDDTLTVSSDGRTVTFSVRAGSGGAVDQVRVLLAQPMQRDGLIVNPSGEINGGQDRGPIGGGQVVGWDGNGGQIINDRTFANNGLWRMSIEDSQEIHQLTDHTVSTGEAFSLCFDAASFSGSPTSVVAELFVEDSPSNWTTAVSHVFPFAPVEVGDWQHFHLATDYGALDAHAGKAVGVRFKGPGSGDIKYLSIDAVGFDVLTAKAETVTYRSAWSNAYDRQCAGPEFWSNRLQDWQVQAGRLACVRQNKPLRTTHLTTCRLGEHPGDFVARVRTGLNLGSTDADSFTGLLVGGGPRLGVRGASLIFYQPGKDGGLLAGLSGQSRAVIKDMTSDGYPPLATDGASTAWAGDASLELTARFDGARYRLELTARRVSDGGLLGQAVLDNVEPARVLGNVALVSHKGGSNAAFHFQALELSGIKIDEDPDEAVGPVISMMHTLSRGTMKLTAQFLPFTVSNEIESVSLQINTNGAWETVAKAPVEDDAYVARFRVVDWDDTIDIPYRVVSGVIRRDGLTNVFYRTGTIKADPVDKEEIVLAGFTGNLNIANAFKGVNNPGTAPVDWTPEFIAFPHAQICRYVAMHAPDILFFSGDQVYEGGSPTGQDTANIKLDYLYKWYLWCRAYRDLSKDIPCIAIPDDHDVFQGNLWGQGGRAVSDQREGGYVHPAWFVKVVEKTQTSNLPDPWDPTPVEQGIGVYYSALNVGGVGLAVIEDRKFKIGSTSVEGTNTITSDDVMLGQRQLDFLRTWGRQWTNEVMKATLSQTVFATTTTHASETLNYRLTDKDSNGWPPVARDRAVDVIRASYTVMIGGDQHLATVVRHGIDAHGDAGYSFCVPSVINAFPRVWDPAHPQSGTTSTVSPYKGEYLDAYGNYMTLLAAANPAAYYNGVTSEGVPPARIHDRAPGYGIVRFHKESRRIVFECWPIYANPNDPSTGGQYPDWPITISQFDNYGREAVGFLPVLGEATMTNPVVQVVNEDGGDIPYTLRIRGHSFRPHVFTGGTYTVTLTVPETGAIRTYSNLVADVNPTHAIQDFSASHLYVASNSSVRLSWDVTGSAGLALTPGVGNAMPYGYNGVGWVDVVPETNTTYSLVSTNTVGGVFQNQLVVRVFETYANWRSRHFTERELSNLSVSGDGADPDGDGIVNIIEYALTTDPRDESDKRRPRVSIAAYDSNGSVASFLTLTYPGVLNVDGLRYDVEYSGDLRTWRVLDTFEPVPVAVSHPGQGQTPVHTDRDSRPLPDYGQGPKYFRLVLRHEP